MYLFRSAADYSSFTAVELPADLYPPPFSDLSAAGAFADRSA
jgi:hypothetical protein